MCTITTLRIVWQACKIIWTFHLQVNTTDTSAQWPGNMLDSATRRHTSLDTQVCKETLQLKEELRVLECCCAVRCCVCVVALNVLTDSQCSNISGTSNSEYVVQKSGQDWLYFSWVTVAGKHYEVV